jgi:hypothetical protein
MKERIEYDFAKEFSPYPGPRNENIGPNSGEKFKNDILKKLYTEEQPILLNIDGTKLSFGPSFLSESFGLFAKEITLEEFKKFLHVKNDTEKGKRFEKKMMEYVEREIENGK